MRIEYKYIMPINPAENIAAAESPESLPDRAERRGDSNEISAAPETAPREYGSAETPRPSPALSGVVALPAAQPATADEAHRKYQEIEKVLEEDLGEIFNNLTPAEQRVFKMKGEEAARNIFRLVYHESKIKVKKIIKAIRDWLKSVPGINRFFLEQESKLKADKILKLAEDGKKIEY